MLTDARYAKKQLDQARRYVIASLRPSSSQPSNPVRPGGVYQPVMESLNDCLQRLSDALERLEEAANADGNLLALALPYVEEEAKNPAYKAGVVDQLAQRIRERVEAV
jgi:hypothetical protein